MCWVPSPRYRRSGFRYVVESLPEAQSRNRAAIEHGPEPHVDRFPHVVLHAHHWLWAGSLEHAQPPCSLSRTVRRRGRRNASRTATSELQSAGERARGTRRELGGDEMVDTTRDYSHALSDSKMTGRCSPEENHALPSAEKVIPSLWVSFGAGTETGAAAKVASSVEPGARAQRRTAV